MTENQINYQKHRESVRANQAQEHLTEQRDVETARANRARESLTAEANEETRRANEAKERENERSNRAREEEAHRSNLATELLKNQATQASLEGTKYAADQSLEGTKYSADQNYTGRVDAAYVNKYGVSKSDAAAAVGAVGDVLTSAPVVKPGVQMVVAGTQIPRNPLLPFEVGVAALNKTFKQLLPNPSRVSKTGTHIIRNGKGGTRHE